jgi:hypothetical protein
VVRDKLSEKWIFIKEDRQLGDSTFKPFSMSNFEAIKKQFEVVMFTKKKGVNGKHNSTKEQKKQRRHDRVMLFTKSSSSSSLQDHELSHQCLSSLLLKSTRGNYRKTIKVGRWF